MVGADNEPLEPARFSSLSGTLLRNFYSKTNKAAVIQAGLEITN
jgi:hypothetical protein